MSLVVNVPYITEQIDSMLKKDFSFIPTNYFTYNGGKLENE